MRKMHTALIAAALVGVGMLCAAPAAGQTIFFDGFDGNTLKPHWTIFPSAAYLPHVVSGGRLTVTDLPLPSEPHIPTNEGGIQAWFSPHAGDFVAEARIGWDPPIPGSPRGVSFSVAGEVALIGSMGYADGSGLRARTGRTQLMVFPPALDPGTYTFTIRRIGDQTRFELDGRRIFETSQTVLDPVASVRLFFTVDYPNTGYSPIHVEYIRMVPAPGSASAALVFCTWFTRRRRMSNAR